MGAENRNAHPALSRLQSCGVWLDSFVRTPGALIRNPRNGRRIPEETKADGEHEYARLAFAGHPSDSSTDNVIDITGY